MTPVAEYTIYFYVVEHKLREFWYYVNLK